MKDALIEGPIVIGDFVRRKTTGAVYEVVGETGHGTKYLGDEHQNVHLQHLAGKGRNTTKWRAAVRREFERTSEPYEAIVKTCPTCGNVGPA